MRYQTIITSFIVFLRRGKCGRPEIVLLDHGLYEYLDFSVRQSLCKFWEAIVRKDKVKMDQYAKELHVNGSPLDIMQSMIYTCSYLFIEFNFRF